MRIVLSRPPEISDIELQQDVLFAFELAQPEGIGKELVVNVYRLRRDMTAPVYHYDYTGHD